MFHPGNVVPIIYRDSYFQSDRDFRKLTSGYLFTQEGGSIVWRIIKQSCVADFTMEVEYVVAYDAVKKVV